MPRGLRSMPVLPSQDVEAALAFWTKGLGFSRLNALEFEGRLSFAIVQLGAITVALQYIETFAPWDEQGSGWSAYLYVDDALALAQDITARGINLEHQPHKTRYGMLEFDLRAPDGHGIAFGQDLGAAGGL